MSGKQNKRLRKKAQRIARRMTVESMEYIMAQGLKYRLKVAWGIITRRMRWQ